MVSTAQGTGLDHHQQGTSNSTLQTLKRLSSLHFYAKPWTMATYINANNTMEQATGDNNSFAAAQGHHNEADDLHDTQEGESW